MLCMILSHKHKFIFLKTRKTGGTSIELMLRNFCGSEDIITLVHAQDEKKCTRRQAQNHVLPQKNWPLIDRIGWGLGDKRLIGKPNRALQGHIRAADLMQYVPEEAWATYTKVTVERNPWDRQVSLYYWRTRRLPEHKRPDFATFLTSDPPPILDNWHIYTINNRVVANVVMRYENLEQDMDGALRALGLARPGELPRANCGLRPEGDYRRLYTDDTRDLVASWYVNEIKEFGYSF